MDMSLKGKRLAEFTYLVERCKIREMAEAIGDPNPLYTDAEAAKAEGFQDVTAPPTFGTCANLWGGPDFQALCEKLDVNPRRVLHAEQEYEYFEPVYPGDTLRATIEVADIFTKKGRSGDMQFAVLETMYVNQKGGTVFTGRSTLLERG